MTAYYSVIEELLAAVTLDAVEPGIGSIDIEYTHAKRTAALIATGWLTDALGASMRRARTLSSSPGS